MFQYSLHSIPCIGFEVFFGGKSIAFTVRYAAQRQTPYAAPLCLRSALLCSVSSRSFAAAVAPQDYSRVLLCA